MTKEVNRFLAAIMFTDMVGYTALMQENEHQAKINRDRHRSVQQEATKHHSGKILQYYGDGTLIIFKSAVEAAGCAVAIQKELQKEPTVPLRIGIHIGDIVHDDEGIYGDGVNIASRIEGLAKSGSVLMSGKMADDIKNHSNFSFQSMGTFNLKNVKEPVEIYALTNKGLNVPESEEIQSQKAERIKSIAVLPFINMSSDPENEYFSDGLTEELLNALSKVDGLMVTARTSSFAFKGETRDIREIGKQLGVRMILEGSVRKAGNRVRVTAQLISAVDGFHIWSENYDRHLEDIFEIQDEISQIITNRLREKFCLRKAKEKLVIPSTSSLEAYNLYLKSLFYQNKWTLIDSQTAIKLLERAIELDPDFALAYAELSGVYGFLAATGKMSPQIAYPRVKEYAFKAQKLDPDLSDSYLALASYYFWMEWNWKEANKCINQAIKKNPSYAEAYLHKSIISVAAGKIKEAFVTIQLSLQLDPLSGPANHLLALIYLIMDKKDKSLEQVEKTLKIDPNFLLARNLEGTLKIEQKEYDKAAAIFEKVMDIPGNEAAALSSLGRIHAKKGETDKAKEYLDRLLALEKEMPDRPISFQIALLYAVMKDADNMFLYLNRCIETKNGEIVFMHCYKPIKKYRKDPRYIELTGKLGFVK
jgi:TolB-like protein/Tfp pilus assembly protein PilF